MASASRSIAAAGITVSTGSLSRPISVFGFGALVGRAWSVRRLQLSDGRPPEAIIKSQVRQPVLIEWSSIDSGASRHDERRRPSAAAGAPPGAGIVPAGTSLDVLDRDGLDAFDLLEPHELVHADNLLL